MISTQLQVTLLQRLTGHAPLMAAIKAVHDEVPQDLKTKTTPNEKYFPFVVIGDDLVRPWDADAMVGNEVFSTINVWSVYKGRKQIKDIAAIINELLHRVIIDIPGYNSAYGLLQQFEILPEPDGLAKKGVLIYKFTAIKN